MKRSGAEILVEVLLEEGVDTVFGYPGNAVLRIYDALYARRDRIRHVLTAHEQGAAHAADGYARSTGRTGVVLATSGPGATNLVTGIAAAAMDSVPLVAITGNVSLDLIGRDSFQEIDITGITIPVTKHNLIVKDVRELAALTREAFLIARSGRPGPVLIDIPQNVAWDECDYTPASAPPALPARLAPPVSSDAALRWAASMLRRSRRPLILAGGGVGISGAETALAALATRLQAPVCTTLPGITSVPRDFPLRLGMVGMYGSEAAHAALEQCDLLLAVGTRFSDRVARSRAHFAPQAKLLHLDIDPSELNKNLPADLTLPGDAAVTLRALEARLSSLSQPSACWAQALLPPYAAAPRVPAACRTSALLASLAPLLGEDAILVTDVGQHQMLAAQLYPFSRPRSFLSSCGLGAMGYGMGAAVGAAVANPGRRVALVTGDGSFHMNLAELATAVSNRLPILVLVMNNRMLGMVHQLQHKLFDGRYACTEPGWATDFAAVARAMGAVGLRVTEAAQFAPAVEEALRSGRPAVLDCLVEPETLPTFPV